MRGGLGWRHIGADTARTSAPPQPSALSVRFGVDDLTGAAIVGSRLHNILTAWAAKQTVLAGHKAFLRQQGAAALADLIDGAITEADYAARAPHERAARQQAAQQHEQEAAAAQRHAAALAAERDAVLQARLHAEAEQRQAARIRCENSPEFIARQKTKALLGRYGVGEYIEPRDFRRLLSAVQRLDAGGRLMTEDVVWLKGRLHRYGLADVLAAHHRREAEVCIAEYRRGGDPWQAINASAHLRKCGAAGEALDLLASVPVQRLASPKPHSALLTTRGGALRDLQRRPEALQAGEAAHALLDRDYRPCTLLGALHMQQGDVALGHDWYRKAEERGAPPAGHDAEIRALLRGLPEDKRGDAIAELLRLDAARYAWLNKKPKKPG